MPKILVLYISILIFKAGFTLNQIITIMSIIFGHKHFKIKEINPQELGLPDDYDYHIEIRQKYFHIYWIPFFGLGKIWAIRRNGELYELPNEYHHLIQERQIEVKSPWYTYTLCILILLGFMIYFGIEKVEDYNRINQTETYINETDFGYKIENATINQIYTLKDMKDYSSDAEMYLKVEKIYTDRIRFSIIPRRFVSSSASEIEDYYNKNKMQLKVVTILKSDLKNSYVKDYQATESQKFNGKNLLKTANLYRISAIDERFRIIINAKLLSANEEEMQIQLKNTGTALTILSIKNIQNNVPWDIELPLKINAGTETNPVSFILKNQKKENFSFLNNDNYRTEIKVSNSLNMKQTFYLTGNKNYSTIEKQF